MSSRHLPVAPLTRAIVEADLESCRQKVEGFSSYCDELVQSVHTYAEQMQKKKGRKKAKEPVLVFPRRPSGRESLNITNLLGDTLMGARTRGGLEPISPPVAEVQRTLDFSQLQQGSSKRHNEEIAGGPAVKRLRSAEELSLEVAQNDSGPRVPRTRSKARGLATAPAGSSRSDAANEENALALPINQLMKGLSAEKSGSRTPGNTASKTVNSKIPKKERDDVLRNNKEEEAVKKKRELMNQEKEEIRKNRETKVKKVAESRAAVEKEKFLQLEREKKEKEEKERQARAELQRKKEEELLKKKLLNQQKAQEAEERRIREEKIRFARLKEQEEEQRRAAEARQRQLEEAERLAALRKAQEKEEEQLRAIEKERREREREKARVARAAPPKDDPDDIGIDDADGEETAPRRPIPKWADTVELNAVLLRQSYYIEGGVPVHAFFETAPATPNLKEIFGTDALPRLRTSSQFWPKTPPHPEPKSAE